MRVLSPIRARLRAIYQHERKSDRRDALMLARIGRMDPALLYPVRHGREEAQQDLLRIKLRDSLVRARVALINSVRFTLKSLGYTMRNPSSERFHKVAMEDCPRRLPDDCSQRAGAGRAQLRASSCSSARSNLWPEASILRRRGCSRFPEWARSPRSILF